MYWHWPLRRSGEGREFPAFFVFREHDYGSHSYQFRLSAKPSRQETKADITTRTARQIMDSETAAREAKTERLRAARLAQEASVKPVAETETVKKVRRKH